MKQQHYLKIGPGETIEPNVQLGVLSPRLKRKTPLVLGPKANLRSGSVLYAGTVVGKNIETGHNVVIREGNKIGHSFRIWNNSTVDYGCRIGNRVKIHCNCYVAQFSVLEDDVFLAPGVTISNDLYPTLKESTTVMKGPHLEKGVVVGVNATILPYVRIEKGSLIGAGAVVTKNIPPYSLVYGNPAQIKGRVQPAAWKKRIKSFK